MALTFENAELVEARRVNRLLAASPRMTLRTPWDVAVINGVISLSQALPAANFKRAGIKAEDRRVEADGRDVAVRILRPDGPCRGVYIHIHGGAWVLGNARMDDRLSVQMIQTCGMAVVSVDYRLAMKNPVHAVLDDCETAALWVLANLRTEFDTDRLFLGGESAGAHLAASTAIRMRNRGVGMRELAGLVLFYGCYDLAGTPSLWAAGPDTLILHGPTLAKAMAELLADLSEDERRDPALSPLYADLRGLPPALFFVGEKDPLLDDTLMLAERWQAANGNAELHRVPEAPHGFNRLPTRMARKTNAYVHGWLFGKIAVAQQVSDLLDAHPPEAGWPGERLAG
jgi:acetyl esterase/lipase